MPDAISEFIKAACVPRHGSHSSGTLQEAEDIRTAHPQIETANVFTAAILGNAEKVRDFLKADPKCATAQSGPYHWDALTYLCFSRYLRLDPRRSAGLVSAATMLLDAGASATTGFFENDHEPNPEFESVLYGAAGIAHHPELTKLLLESGADPNDGEVTYHAPESSDNRALEIIVRTGRLNADSLATMLLRKCDWHDYDGIRFLVEHGGADPNRITYWGLTALHQSVRRDNALENVAFLLDHGGNPTIAARDEERTGTAIALAARRGRKDLLELFAQRGWSTELQPIERLAAACACDHPAEIQQLLRTHPELHSELQKEGGMLVAEFAGTGNTRGVRHWLDLGVSAASLYPGDGYFGIAPQSTALHVAAWRARPETVKLLIERGAPVNALDGQGRTPLQLAVKACVDSFWTERRTPDSVRTLLEAGVSMSGVPYPSGYGAVDRLLKDYGAK
jgi:ankyrin repeat protein